MMHDFKQFETEGTNQQKFYNMEKRISQLELNVGDILKMTILIYAKMSTLQFSEELEFVDQGDPSSWKINNLPESI